MAGPFFQAGLLQQGVESDLGQDAAQDALDAGLERLVDGTMPAVESDDASRGGASAISWGRVVGGIPLQAGR